MRHQCGKEFIGTSASRASTSIVIRARPHDSASESAGYQAPSKCFQPVQVESVHPLRKVHQPAYQSQQVRLRHSASPRIRIRIDGAPHKANNPARSSSGVHLHAKRFNPASQRFNKASESASTSASRVSTSASESAT